MGTNIIHEYHESLHELIEDALDVIDWNIQNERQCTPQKLHDIRELVDQIKDLKIFV